MALSLDQFVERLSQSGLIPAAEIKAFLDSLPPTDHPANGESLAQILVRAGTLTRYQAVAVVQGKAESLVLDSYLVLDKLGQGATGTVYKARHRVMQRIVAVKVLHRNVLADSAAVRRFYRETEIMARLAHPNIVRAYDASRGNRDTHYLVMEHVEGDNLKRILEKKRILPILKAVDCVLQAARGLQYAHAQGIVHRDIKPGNLLLDNQGVVKILDLGLARFMSAAEASGINRLTLGAQAMGTFDYMAPEQSMDAHRVDARADIYSLGCTLYRLLIGRPLYRAQTLVELFLAHQNAPIPSLCGTWPDVPVKVDAIFRKMVAKRPADRYPTADAVVADLDAVLRDLRREAGDETVISDPALTHFLDDLREPRSRVAPVGPEAREDTPPQPAKSENADTHDAQMWRRVWQRMFVPVGVLALIVPYLIAGAIIIGLTVRPATESLRKMLSRWSKSSPVAAPPVAVSLDAEMARAYQNARASQEACATSRDMPVSMANSIRMKFALIPPGEFLMGTPPYDSLAGGDEAPRHRVRIARPFYLGVYEVTQAEYRGVIGGRPSYLPEASPSLPEVMVSWEDAVEFCHKLSQFPDERVEGRVYRLPTEAEWEHACRAETTTDWWCGNDPDALADRAWFASNAERTHPVGLKKPNAWGLHDIHGNVSEWCSDWYSAGYYKQPAADPRGPSTGSSRVVRGGFWKAPATGCRSAFRAYNGPANRSPYVGFRVVAEVFSP